MSVLSSSRLASIARHMWVGSFALFLSMTAMPGFAQDEGVAPARQSVSIDGFRSAKFGMSQTDVRAAIVSDFQLQGEDVKLTDNPVERTEVISVTVPDVLDGGGIAEVSYVFGFKSAALIQAGISWSSATDPDMDPIKLYANGEVLRRHFLSQGFVPTNVQTSVVLDDGVLLFRGTDANGHAAILLLQGDFADKGDGEQALVPSSLTLLYAQNADDPDVFEVPVDLF